ncbi:MAG TPA: amino acid adenylation domain-containing protein, partial [Candidatus Angelobacter sp.]
NQSTLYMTLLAVFGMLLSRYSGQDDIVVGSPIANRQEEQLEELIGFFVNSLVMRVRPRTDISFGELLSQVRQTALAAYEHQDVPFERLVEELSPERSLNTTPLFQVMFAVQNARMDKQQLKQLEVNPVNGGELRVRFDLEVHAFERGGEMTVSWLYNRDLFDRWRMEQMSRHYVRMLDAVVREPGCVVGRVEMLSVKERHQLLYDWNDTGTDFPADKCVHELFEEQAARTPDAVAVVCEYEELSYRELNRRANQLAHYLRKAGVGTGDTVAILLERSIHLVVSEIAVLKCNAAYVPIDPAYSEERKAFLISDCKARAVLVCEETVLPEVISAARVNINKLVLDEEATADLYTPLDGEALAYVMYTSGSTGQPKGVMVPHRGITRLICNNNYAQFSKDDRMAFGVNPSFDVSTLEVWAPLLNGGCIVIIKQKTLLDPAAFARTLEQQAVTILWLTVGLFNQYAHVLQKQFAGLRYLMSGGDVLDPAVVARVLSSHAPQHLLNGYGPTESTTFTTTYEIAAVREDGSSIPIGRPISNTQVYILDAQGEPAPVGVVGELYIGGAGVALGYLNRPELTAEKFVTDPFSGEPGARMYRSGDLGRWLADGNIEFLGRNDFQVKIRGFRVELGEIEARLAKHPAVREAFVVAREERPGDKRLVAYYTTSLKDGPEANVPSEEQLRAYLSTSLPEYMVPSAFMALEAWPLTPNGKLDRRALPAPEMDSHTVHGSEPPQGDVETMLASIWAETLRLDQVNRHDDFFRLGGHSLLTLRVVTLLQQRGFIITVADIFANPTIESLAAKLKSRETPDSADIAVQINVGSADHRPLFLTHCGNGELLYASAVAPHIDRNIPLYGLPAIPAYQTQSETIEEIATRMVRMIRFVQPAGPYRVAGWSGGGNIAYEIASQLIGAHEQVEFFAMFDTLCPRSNAMARRANIDFNDSAFLLDLIESAGTEGDGRKAALDAMRASLHTMEFPQVVQECDRLSLIPDTLRYLTTTQTRLKLARTHSLAVASARYQPRLLHIPVHLFAALDAQNSGDSCPHRGWNEVVPSDLLRVTPVPGTHHSMLRSPNVELLGRSLTQAICHTTR